MGATGSGTKADPWVLRTPPGTSDYTMYRDEAADPPALVCQVGSTQLKYHWRAVDDLHAMLLARGDWMELGVADEQKEAKPGTVEAWGRDPGNPVGGWYGLRKGYRGRFGMYVPPLLEALGMAELTQVLQKRPGVAHVTAFGNTLHVTGASESELDAAIAPLRGEPGLAWRKAPSTLEDVFIHLMSTVAENGAS